jgi:hypothetical protein
VTSVQEHVKELSQFLSSAQHDLKEDSSYYESEHRLKAIGVSTPPEMRTILAQVGWPRTYLDSLEERLDVEGFRLASQSDADSRLWEWWQANNMDIESGLGHIESLIHGRAYVTVAAPEEGDVPVIRVESPNTMYAEIDPRTQRVTRALRLYQSPYSVDADGATLFLPDRTVILEKSTRGNNVWAVRETIKHELGFVPVVPLVNRARLSEREGRSEIVPELRSVTDAAARIMMNMQATAELMAVPQRLLFGVAQEALAADPENPASVIETYLARIIAVEDADAHAFQWTAAELMNFVNVLQELAKQAAVYTGLPPQYLSFSSENPASAEAIRSAESRLVKKAERKARMFGGAWEQVMRLGMLVIDGEIPQDAYRLETLWRDPSTPTYAAKADAVTKLYNSGAGIIPLERARIDMGYSDIERQEMRKWDLESPTTQLNALMGLGNRLIPSPSEGDDELEEE